MDPKNIGITIIQGIPSDGQWWYAFEDESQTQRTKAKDIMSGKSTAKYCYDTGESLFISDIRKGKQEGGFLISDRSKRNHKGSIYCKPVRIVVNSKSYIYIFSIVVYGQFLCVPYDEDECKACERLLDEVSDRIELELFLHAMKEFKDNRGGDDE